jgi:putative transposase
VIRSLLYLFFRRLLGLFRSSESTVAEADLEIVVLRHQLAILRRQVKRPVYRKTDRAFLAAASRLLPRQMWPSFMVRPETLLRWHRELVRRKWTQPYRRPGRPAIDLKGALIPIVALTMGFPLAPVRLVRKPETAPVMADGFPRAILR